jgi:peptide/nickel transport system permease protein
MAMNWNNRLTAGIAILAVLVPTSAVLPLFAPANPIRYNAYAARLPVSLQHPLGTNSLGQDLFWYLTLALRNSIVLGVCTAFFILVVATALGLLAGYLGGRTDRVVMLFVDTFISIPAFPILIVLASVFRESGGFYRIGLILLVFGWAYTARMLRSMALSVREREFVNTARFSGASTLRIVFREIFPYVYSYGVVGFINAILYVVNTEAALAVIGISSVQVPSLGTILYWGLQYNAFLTGQYNWILGPVGATVLLFVGLFLTSTGYNQLSAERRGHA